MGGGCGGGFEQLCDDLDAVLWVGEGVMGEMVRERRPLDLTPGEGCKRMRGG